jgi:hypothetical protein
VIHISILVLRNAVVASIMDSAYVFEKVNEFLKESGKASLFKIQLVGFTEDVKFNSGKYIIKSDVVFESVKKPISLLFLHLPVM